MYGSHSISVWWNPAQVHVNEALVITWTKCYNEEKYKNIAVVLTVPESAGCQKQF